MSRAGAIPFAVLVAGLHSGVPAHAQHQSDQHDSAAAGGLSAPARPGSPGAPPATAPGAAQPAQTPAAEPAGAPPPGYPYPPAPGYPAARTYPPAYAYPPGSAYPAPYGYPAPYAYPRGYPGYPPPAMPPAPEPPPAPPPAGKWRIGAALFLVPQGYLSYDLKYRGEALLSYARGTSTTAGVTGFAELDPVRHVFVALALQVLPSIKWEPPPSSAASSGSAFGGTGREVDFLPQVGLTISPTPRLRLLGYAAPGYAILFASHMTDAYADPGTAHGFALQVGAGVLFSVGSHAFVTIRGAKQWSYPTTPVHSSTTGETADVHFRFDFYSVLGGGGYWF